MITQIKTLIKMVPLYFSVLLRFSPIEVMPSKDSIHEYVLCFHKNVEIIQPMVWNKISKFEQYTPV